MRTRHGLIPRARNLIINIIYLAALAVWLLLVYRTITLAQAEDRWPVLPTAASRPHGASPAPATVTALAAIAAIDPTALPAAAALRPTSPALPLGSAHPKTGRYIAAWLPPSFSGDALKSFEANKDIIDEISPFWYGTDASGRLYSDGGARDQVLVQVAHDNNVLVIPTVHNIGLSADIAGVLSDPQRRTRHIQNIVDEVQAYNYDGMDIDYESLDRSLRPAYSAFIKDLAEALHARGKLLTVAAHAKSSDYGGLGGYQDWKVIGQYVDQLRIMTYDYHWRGGGPGPVAPLYWVSEVAEYARSVTDPAKIVIGVPFYGYDWPPGGNARALPWGDIEDLIVEQGLTVNQRQRDNRGRVDESYFYYRSPEGMREVWFMTDSGLDSKLEAVQSMDLAGIAIWQLGYEKPEYWQVIRRRLVEDPFVLQRAINPLLPEH